MFERVIIALVDFCPQTARLNKEAIAMLEQEAIRLGEMLASGSVASGLAMEITAILEEWFVLC